MFESRKSRILTAVVVSVVVVSWVGFFLFAFDTIASWSENHYLEDSNTVSQRVQASEIPTDIEGTTPDLFTPSREISSYSEPDPAILEGDDRYPGPDVIYRGVELELPDDLKERYWIWDGASLYKGNDSVKDILGTFVRKQVTVQPGPLDTAEVEQVARFLRNKKVVGVVPSPDFGTADSGVIALAKLEKQHYQVDERLLLAKKDSLLSKLLEKLPDLLDEDLVFEAQGAELLESLMKENRRLSDLDTMGMFPQWELFCRVVMYGRSPNLSDQPELADEVHIIFQAAGIER